jgi:hypothetical protein
MLYLFQGDTHGDLDFVQRTCEVASEHGAEIINLGDWGFLWPGGSQSKYLSKMLVMYGVTMRFIDGNHDWHKEIWRRAPGVLPAEIEKNLIYQPRGSFYRDPEGTKFLFMGGAPSIDKHMRRDGISWWKEEEITDEDMDVALTHKACDVLVTHDAPNYPPGYGPKGTPEFRVAGTRSMNNIKKLRTKLTPKLHVHGHWHHAYIDGVTRGLDCNYARYFNDSIYLWDSKGLYDKVP